MKKVMTKLMACGLCVTMLTGCGGSNTANTVNQNSETDAIDSASTAGKKTEDTQSGNTVITATGSAADAIAQLKVKYAEQDNYEYTDPLYNLEKDHVFTFDIAEPFFDIEAYDAFKVFYDGSFENQVDATIEADYDKMEAKIEPNISFSYEDEQGSIVTDGTWGTRSKFWLVQYLDTKTGETLDKPIVTVFSIAQDLDTPTLTQGVNENGYYNLSWTEVKDADYYEVYSYDPDMDFAMLETTTEDTSVEYSEFETAQTYDNDFNDTYAGTEMEGANHWLMNTTMDPIYGYFIVAKNDDGDCSGMSNECYVKDIANQIPYKVSDDFQYEYSGSTATALPAYADVTMVDGSIGQYLIEYHGAKATHMEDGSIMIDATLKSLPISMMSMTFTGMDYDAFLEDVKNVTEREDGLETKSVTTSEDVDIPYVPENTEPAKDTDEEDKKTEENTDVDEEPADKEEPVEEVDTDEEEPVEEVDTDEEEPVEEDVDTDEEEEPAEEEEEPAEENQAPVTTGDLDLAENVAETVFGNSALSEWIGLNLLAHQETISLNDFPEAADSQYLTDAFFEASQQNPLCGVWNTVQYDYNTNSLLVTYVLSAEETQTMQQDCLNKAAEIAESIIEDGMSDLEKETAINTYLCDNASYNMEIMDYINEDGTISEDAVHNFVHSFTPYGILVENYGVCESYAEAFQLIARAAGLEVVIESGTLSGVNHEWNRIHMDGNWYTMDVTNNDSDYVKNALFNLSDETAASILKQDNDSFIDEYVGNYTASDNNNEFYNLQGLYTEDPAEAASKLAELLQQGSTAAVRMDSTFGGSSVDSIAQDAITQSQVGEGQYTAFANVILIVTK